MVFAGLRISEVLDLKCMDVELSERKGSVTIQSGKGGTRRTVPMSTTLREMVQFYLQDRSGASEFLFSGEKDGNLTPRAVQKRVQQLETRLGIDGLFPHALRHTTAKSMLDGGAKLTQVQRIMGHKRIDTTTHYTMPSQEDLLEALELGEIGRGAK